MATKTEQNLVENLDEALHAHSTGDAHSARGFHYECAWRCIWLLELRGTGNRIAVANGEDAKLIRANGTVTFRQVKKKEGSHWSYDRALRGFVERAFFRFSSTPSVRHEFYTNQAVPSGLCEQEYLNKSHSGVKQTAHTSTEAFCKTVRFYQERYQPDPSLMVLVLKERLREIIDEAYPGCQARNFVTEREVDELAAKLLMFEYELWSGREVGCGWAEVNAKLGLDALISDLRARSLADGTLTPFERYPAAEDGGPDTDQTRAIEAVRARRIIARPTVESQLWSITDEWWEGRAEKQPDYLVAILVGGHGTGKTWTLTAIGSQLPTKYPGLSACVAVTDPPDRSFAFGNLAISQPGPCAVLIDEIFPDWSGPLSNITRPPYPLLVLGTAARPVDDDAVQKLLKRLGRRANVVELPDHVDEPELECLADARGAPPSTTERDRAKATNIRHVAELLTGRLAPEHLGALSGLLQRPELLEVLGPILVCTSLRVGVPRELLEKTIGRSLPPDIQPWVLGARGSGARLLAIEDPGEAARLIADTLGGARLARLGDWCEKLVQQVQPERRAERAFVRHLFGRLAAGDQDVCAVCVRLLDSCRSAVDAVMDREPLWALVFSWLPILARTGRDELIAIALGKMTATPASAAEIAVLIEAYGVASARRHLEARLRQLGPWNPVLLARFIETIMMLKKDERRDTAAKVTRLLVDLPIEAFAETLRQRNCFHEATNLAADFGWPDDRRAFLARIGDVVASRLASGGILKQNWFEAMRVLTERVISQARSGLAMAIHREIFLKGNIQFKAREYFQSCFDEEQAIIHRPLIEVGLRVMLNAEARSANSLPPVTGGLAAFAASWANDEESAMVADAFIEHLESLAKRDVSFDRLSAEVLPTFAGIRGGPQQRGERFLRAVLSWMPDEGRLVTDETAKLVLQVLGFVATQPWVGVHLQEGSKRALLELARRGDAFDASVRSLLKDLHAVLGIVGAFPQTARMPAGWLHKPSLANTYLTQVGRIRWKDEERTALVASLIDTWQAILASRQNLTEALLRLGQLEEAERFARNMALDAPGYPDSFGYLAIAAARRGNASEAEGFLAKAAQVQDQGGRGLHLHLANWVHRELAAISEGQRRAMHLLCAELSRDRPLRAYEEVVGETIE